VAPGLQVSVLPQERLGDEDALAAIDIAVFSFDIHPASTKAFFGTCLAAPNLRWLHTGSAGTDFPVFGKLQDRGVRLTTSSGAAAVPIAHTVIMQLLALTRDAPRWAREQAAKQWNGRDVVDMEGRTVAIVGLGPIGLEVARLCAEFGMHPIGVRRFPRGDEPCETWPISRLDEALRVADDVVLAAPLTDETRGLLSRARIAAMKPGVHLVNVGRGETVDEPALIDALRRGHLGGAALDVFAVEPLPDASPLWALPNVIVTPHAAGTTRLSRHRAMSMFIDNLARFVAGQPLVNEAG
jgi:phosphoglycerate dehydrogenase-like enzyme